MKPFQVVIGFLIAIVSIMLLSYAFGWFGVSYTKTVGKAQQNAETEVYKSSQTYIDGKNQRLSTLKLQYVEDTAVDSRRAIRLIIIQEFAGFDETKLTPDLQLFLQQIRQ